MGTPRYWQLHAPLIALSLSGCQTAGSAFDASSASAAPMEPIVEHRWTSGGEFSLCPTPGGVGLGPMFCQKVNVPHNTKIDVLRKTGSGHFYVRIGDAVGYIASYEYSAQTRDYDLTAAVEAERKEKAANKARKKADCDRRGGVSVGMTRAQVYASCWGKPERINKTITGSHTREQLVYHGYNYLYLVDGVLSSIQTSQ